MRRTNEVESEKEKEYLQSYIECIESEVNVVSVPQVSALAPDRRMLLGTILGRYGLESAVLALTPGCIWWTDDLLAAEIAGAELGVERVWSQPVLEHAANVGLIDRTVVEESYAKLLGFDYQLTSFTASVLVAAVRLSNGSLSTFPLEQMIRCFVNLAATDPGSAFRLLGEFILKTSFEPMLPETKCVVTKALLNSFPPDQSTTTRLDALCSQCFRLLAVNPIAQTHFLDCFGQWKDEGTTRRYIISPS